MKTFNISNIISFQSLHTITKYIFKLSIVFAWCIWNGHSNSDTSCENVFSSYIFFRFVGLGPDGQLPLQASGQVFAEAQQIVCGKNSTFVIQFNGDVYSCGEGSNGRLGHGNSDDLPSLSLITGLRGFRIVQVSCSVGDGGHVLAVAASGEVFSWGNLFIFKNCFQFLK